MMVDRIVRRGTVFALGLLVGGIGAAMAQPADEAGAEASAEASAEVSELAARVAAADPDRGKRHYLQCRSCHTLEEGGRHLTGPNLWGIIDRPAGTYEGFRYSDALLESEVVWTLEALDTLIEKPADIIPGTKMIFRGIRDADRRAELLAYIARETTPAPEATEASDPTE